MTTRDRLVLLGILVLGVLAAGWMLGVSPEREKAAKLDAEVSAAQAQLATAQQQLSEAQGDQTQYTTAYASIVRLGKAVPANQEVPSLVYELDQASNQKNVEFNSIAASVTGGSSSSSSSSSSAAASAASASFTQMPFTFVFNGSFVDLFHLLSQIQGFTVQTAAGAVQVSGRLLTIQSADLELPSSSSGASEGAKGSTAKKSENAELKGTITATAYVLPGGQGLTGGATPAGPVGASSAQPAASTSTSSSSSATPAAVVKVTP
jgi:type II secretory pathway pseudopilin PulG